MHKRTDLAAGTINGFDRLHVELIQPPDTPAFIAVNWPAAATICHATQLPGCGRGDHTAHRRIRYRPGTVEAARPMNRDARRPGGNAAEVLAEARRAYAAKLATSLKWVQSS